MIVSQVRSYAERLVGTLRASAWDHVRRELFDRLLIVNERDLRQVLTEYLAHHNTARPHRAARQLASAQAHTWRPQINLVSRAPFRRKQALGGLTHEPQVVA